MSWVDGERAIAPKLIMVGLLVGTTGGVSVSNGSEVSVLGEVVGETDGELVGVFVASTPG